MKKCFFVLVFSLLSGSFLFAQGNLKGKISDENGMPLLGVNFMLNANGLTDITTDLNGNYLINISDSLGQEISVSLKGYQTMTDSFQVKSGAVLVKDFVLPLAVTTINKIVIGGKKAKAKDTYMEEVKQKSAVTLDYISSETLKKTGDANLTAAVTRVSGVSSSGGLITVRGIGDRYVKTTFNGSRIPTLDPFTNNIRLDMFPAALIDNVVIAKTASPDLPGDWAGAYISVETKEYPKKLAITVESAIGYNAQTTFKEVVSSQHSATDWLGYDNGFRDHSMKDYQLLNNQPSRYQEFVALGYGDFLKSVGVSSSSIYSSSGASSQTYDKLVFQKMGLLGASNFNDPNAYNAALEKYNQGTYQGDAYKIMNAGAVKFNQSLPNNWRTTNRQAPLNTTQSITFGNQLNFFGRPLGLLAGCRYSSATQYDPNSSYGRVTGGPTNGVYIDTISFPQKITRETNEWSALVNVMYKYHKNHSINLIFMPNVNGTNNVGVASRAGDAFADVQRQLYESRKQFIYQAKLEHYIPWHKIKIEGNASYTDGKSIVPDFKRAEISANPAAQNSQINNSARYFRYLTENVFDSRLAVELPLKGNGVADAVRKIKFGAAFQRIDRAYDQIGLTNINSGNMGNYIVNSSNAGSDPLGLDFFGFIPVPEANTYRALRGYLFSDNQDNHVMGFSNVSAAYAMADYSIVPRLRLSGGLRVEKAYIYTDSKLADSLNLPVNDPRRISNPGKLNEVSFLPSISAIYKLRKDAQSPINLRFNFSQTVARPGLRELSTSDVYDYELNDRVRGNPNLKMVNINNYDLRLESYFKSGDNVSLSLFYKDFMNYIELYNATGFTWENNPNPAWLRGIELEGKKKLTKYFEFRANVTFVDSRSTFSEKRADGTFGAAQTRTLFGQAPYLVNSILTYTSDSIGLQVTLSYNVQGPKLVIAGDVTSQIPSVYELPRNLLDLKISKKIGKSFSASFRVTDILNAARIRAYQYQGNYIWNYDRYQFGTNFILSLSYKL